MSAGEQQKHSPLPWHTSTLGLIVDAIGRRTASCGRNANAELIVAAVNGHDALLATLDNLLAALDERLREHDTHCDGWTRIAKIVLPDGNVTMDEIIAAVSALAAANESSDEQ